MARLCELTITIVVLASGCRQIFGLEEPDLFVHDAATTLAIVVGGSSDDTVYGLSVDAMGNLYAVGRFGATIDFGAGEVSSRGAHDAFVASYWPTGALRWAQVYGSTGDDFAGAITLVPDGLAISGRFAGPIDFGDGVVTPSGPDDGFVLRLTSDGELVSSAQFGGGEALISFGNDDVRALAVGPSGQVYMGGKFKGTADFGAGPETSVGTGLNGFIATLDSPAPWSFIFGEQVLNTVLGLAADQSSVYVAGYYEGSPDLGMGPLPQAGIQDGLIARLDATTGTLLWAHGYGGPKFEYVNRVGIAPDGTAFGAGFFENTIDFGQGPIVGRGSRDAFLIAIEASGVQRFTIPFGSTGCDDARAILVDDDGVWVAGTFEMTMTIGTTTIEAQSGRDTFVAKFTHLGELVEVVRIGDTPYDAPTAIARTPRGTLVVAGTTDGPGECGGASGGDGDGDAWIQEL